MEIGRKHFEEIQKLIDEKRPAATKIHLSKHAEEEIIGGLSMMM
jgi:hypothetical protein